MTLVMSDLRMPKMDGLELLRQVRGRWPDIAVVMITAVADVEVAVSCLAIGAMDYLTKPFHLEEVRARVAQALEKRRLVLENRGFQESLQEKVAVQARRLEELFLASIQSLAEALEVKDPYTRGHSMRVSHYSVVIARELGLDGELLRQIELGGHVHDIGKIGVREEVLNKPGKLTDAEYEHIMTHPVVGWRILAPLLARDAGGAQHRALAPRAVRRPRHARPARRRRDPARGAHRGGGRLVRRDDERPALPPRWNERGGGDRASSCAAAARSSIRT